MEISQVRALVFDVFGTVVDWRTSITAEVRRLGEAKGLQADWEGFADGWRGKYGPFMNKVRQGELPWTKLDTLHRMALEELLQEMGIAGLTGEEKAHLNLAWHRLDPWARLGPGPRPPEAAVRHRHPVQRQRGVAHQHGQAWGPALGLHTVGGAGPGLQAGPPWSTRPPRDLLGLPVNQVMMVAAHQGDLRAAQAVGLRSAFVPRPLERGPNAQLDLTPDPSFDVVAQDFVDLAQKLGA